MKKFLFILIASLFVQPVMAKSVKVEALSDFSTENPPKIWQVKILESFVANDGFEVNAGSIIEGRIEGVKNAKRLKRDGTFKFIPEFYYDSKTGATKQVKRDFVGKYSKRSELDAKTVAKKGAITAGNIFIGSFVGPSVALVEGTIKNEKGNRAKSAAVSVYESTPLSYANKGKELEFKQGQVFVMNIKLKKDSEEEENLPNYSYEIEE